MKIIAKIDGWEKHIEVEPHIMEKGIVKVAFRPPISNLVFNQGAEINYVPVTEIDAPFYFHSYNSIGIPVFIFRG